MQDLEAKSNSSGGGGGIGRGGGVPLGGSRRQGAPTIPEYLAKAPCWSEKREGSRETVNQLRGEKSRVFPPISDIATKGRLSINVQWNCINLMVLQSGNHSCVVLIKFFPEGLHDSPGVLVIIDFLVL